MRIARKAEVSPSLTVTINTLAVEKAHSGIKVYNLSLGDLVLPCHDKIICSANKILEKKYINYPVVAGIAELRKLALDWMRRCYDVKFDMENVLVTVGGKFVLYVSCQALLNDGDEVLIPSPYWVSYPEIVKLFGGVPKILESAVEKRWKICGDDILRHATAKTKMIIFNNPCNPTGELYTHEEIADILFAAAKADLIVISDEVYSEIVYDDNRFVSCGAFQEFRDRLVIIQSCSKNFGMTGWRIGFAFAPPSLISVMNNLQGQSTTGAPLPSQWAAIGALENIEQVGKYVRDALRDRRDCFFDTYKALFGHNVEKSKSTMYTFLPIDQLGAKTDSSVQFCDWMMDQGNVALVPGAAFGVERYVRISFSETKENIVNALNRIKSLIT